MSLFSSLYWSFDIVLSFATYFILFYYAGHIDIAYWYLMILHLRDWRTLY
jgi:hypothetical protein